MWCRVQVCVSLSRANDGQALLWQGRIRQQCGAWVDAEHLSDVAVAGAINERSVHVLVNLNGAAQLPLPCYTLPYLTLPYLALPEWCGAAGVGK